MDWFKLYAAEFLTDVRRHGLSLEAQGCLLQMCAISAHYVEKIEPAALRTELRPTPSSKTFSRLIAELGPLLDAYLNDVQDQVSNFRAKSQKASGSARVRWARQASLADHKHANASAFADAIAHAEKREKIRSPRPPRGEHAPEFIRFWLEYPRKVAKARAARAWEKLAPDQNLVATMLEALAWQQVQPQWRKDGGAFIPHPATWLNGRRWEDERPVTESPSGDDGFDLLWPVAPSSEIRR